MEESKICSKCSIDKPVELFPKRSKDRGGYDSQCKECVKKHQQSRKNDSKIEITSKICTKCNIERLAEEYHKNSISSDGLHSACKYCRKEYDLGRVDKKAEYSKKYSEKNSDRIKKYRLDNKEKTKEYKKQYRKENSDVIKKWKSKNRDRINAKDREWRTNRRKTDVVFKLKDNIRGLILQTFRNSGEGGYKKNSKTADILGCSIEEFKKHIESQFLPWMSWENHGKCETNDYNCSWELDHILPVSLARTEEELYLLNHWSNFQPLCSRVNLVDKSNTHYFVCNLELEIDSSEYFKDITD